MALTLTRLRQQPAWIALFIFIVLCLWVASGMISAQEETEKTSIKKDNVPLVKVTVRRFEADEVIREITMYGRTEPDRSATLRAEVKGLVDKIYVQEGESVKKGQKIVSLENADAVSRLRSAKAILKQRKIELEGARSLGKKGYQSEAALAQALANLELAKSDVKTYELAILKSSIIAPFDGVVNERFAEIGDLLKIGDKIAMLVDLDPLVISANVTETNVRELQLNQRASGRIVSGDLLEGKVRYISSVSEAGTNTFRVEVAVPNPDFGRLAGMSTELALPLQKEWAIRITPSVMALDEEGNLGVKTIVNERVKFVPIDIVKSDSQGVWLSGMGQRADIIMLGHGFVRDGDKVEVVRVDEELNTTRSIQ